MDPQSGFWDGNTVVGYDVRNKYVSLLFWSGQLFEEPILEPIGKFKAAQFKIYDSTLIPSVLLRRLLKKTKTIRHNYAADIAERRSVSKLKS
jgi:hypothetical protein